MAGDGDGDGGVANSREASTSRAGQALPGWLEGVCATSQGSFARACAWRETRSDARSIVGALLSLRRLVDSYPMIGE